MREVFEETGVKTKFQSVLGFREVQKFKFGQADLYFVCMLEATDEKIDIQMPDEVARAEWIPFVRKQVALLYLFSIGLTRALEVY